MPGHWNRLVSQVCLRLRDPDCPKVDGMCVAHPMPRLNTTGTSLSWTFRNQTLIWTRWNGPSRRSEHDWSPYWTLKNQSLRWNMLRSEQIVPWNLLLCAKQIVPTGIDCWLFNQKVIHYTTLCHIFAVDKSLRAPNEQVLPCVISWLSQKIVSQKLNPVYNQYTNFKYKKRSLNKCLNCQTLNSPWTFSLLCSTCGIESSLKGTKCVSSIFVKKYRHVFMCVWMEAWIFYCAQRKLMPI